MGHVRENRASLLLEKLLLNWLNEGVIPSTLELEEAYTEEKEKHGDLSQPSIRNVSLPQRFEEASALRHKLILDALEDDLTVLLRSLVDITNLSLSELTEWNSRHKALSIRLKSLKSRIESLILMKSDSAGFLSFVEDGFFSVDKVKNTTTTNIDVKTGEVTLNVDSEDENTTQGKRINLSSSQVTWNVIEGGNIRFSSRSAGSDLKHILRDTYSRWGTEINTVPPKQFRTASKTGKPVIGELKIKFSTPEEISKIVLTCSSSNAGTNFVIACQYTTDGYTWQNIPSETSVLSGSDDFIWRFPKTNAGWIKFIITKSSPDVSKGNNSVYDFGIEQVKVYSETFSITSAGEDLYSELLTPTLGDNPVSFGRATLEVCEETPRKTSIQYYLRAYDGSDYTSWVKTLPLNKSQNSSSAVVDFTAPTEYSSEASSYILNTSLDAEALNTTRSNISYRFYGPNDTVLNYYIPLTLDNITDIVLLRNIGYPAAKFPTLTSDLKVGDVECGWGLEDKSIYYCEFWVKNPEGLEIDFGHTQAVLDRNVVSGVVNISAGWHTFRTDRANWGPIESTSSIASIQNLKDADSLYPYNHKYLIEGYTYPANWSGEKIYIGCDEYAQYKSTRVGIHNFIQFNKNLSVYALDSISGPKTIVLVKFDSSRGNYGNERLRLLYKRRFENFTGIELKAKLASKDALVTPVLSYYRIKVK